MTEKNPKHDANQPEKPEELTDEEAEAISGGDPPGAPPYAPSIPAPAPVGPDPWE